MSVSVTGDASRRPSSSAPQGPAVAAGGRSRARLRTLAKWRARSWPLVLLLPAALVVVADLTLRGDRLVSFPIKYLLSYSAAFVESAVLWGVLLCAASARRGPLRWLAAAGFVALASIAVGGQIYFYRQYSTYLNLDATLFGTSMADSLFGQLSADGAHFLSSVTPPALVAVLLVWLGRSAVRTRRRLARLSSLAAPACVLGALLIPCSYRSIQGSTPDVIYFHAIGGLAKKLTGIDERAHVRPKRRTPPALPALAAEPSAPRNVLFVLTESIREDVACSAAASHCPAMPFSNAALPQRIPLLQMRSNSSTTAIQLAVLWSGLEPTAGREALHRAPLLFDFAHAAGIESAYWSSHHPMFANSRLFVQDLPTRFRCSATQLDSLADIDLGARDALLTERIKQQIVELREPFFAVAHYGNTHIPYLVDPAKSPFQPSKESKAPEDNEPYRNFYKNAVYLQDETVADLLRFVRAQPFGERTVIVYTADHGEQFREHGQLGHTGSVFDVEVHVPAWVDAPDGTLSHAERQALDGHREAFTFHTDLTATVLDLMGLWEAPQLADYRERMVGGSLLRPGLAERTVALSNCSGVWGCAFENWGVMRGRRKLLAREWDREWLCYDVLSDADEMHPLPQADCADLVQVAQQRYGRQPGR